MSLRETLQNYQLDPEVIRHSCTVDDVQREFGFDELCRMFGLTDGPIRYVFDDGNQAFDHLFFSPLRPHDETSIRILHAHSTEPDPRSIALKAMRLFAASPEQPLLVTLDPATRLSLGRLALGDIARVMVGSLDAYSRGLASFLSEKGVKRVTHLGYEDGADVAASAVAACSERDIESAGGVFLEPFGVKRRHPVAVLRDILETNQGVTSVRWMHLANIALAYCLSSDGFTDRVANAHTNADALQSVVIWGALSDSCPRATMELLRASLGAQVNVMFRPVAGLCHDATREPAVFAALLMQGQRDISAVDERLA